MEERCEVFECKDDGEKSGENPRLGRGWAGGSEKDGEAVDAECRYYITGCFYTAGNPPCPFLSLSNETVRASAFVHVKALCCCRRERK